MNTSELYGEGYFLRGEGSNYQNYSWQGEPTIKMATALADLLDIRAMQTITDIGCARGYLVRALRGIGIEASGYDTSKWAIENCDENVKNHVSNTFPAAAIDYFFSKDCFEHVPVSELSLMIVRLLMLMRNSMLIVVPLSSQSGGPYVRKEDNMDSTHLIRWPLESWLDYLQSIAAPNEFIVSGSWHWPGLKPTSSTVPKSCGFLLIKRI